MKLLFLAAVAALAVLAMGGSAFAHAYTSSSLSAGPDPSMHPKAHHTPAAKVRRTAAHRRWRPHARTEVASLSASASEAALPTDPGAADPIVKPQDGLTSTTVHYDHGPQGLSDDVTAVGLVHKF